MFWAHYRRTFFRTQLIIAIICLLFLLVGHVTADHLVAPLLVMEAGALYSVRIAGHIKRATERKPVLAPLDRN